MTLNTKIHKFTTAIDGIEIPQEFTYPFNYTPHPLCKIAWSELSEYIDSKEEWSEEIQCGKMFGVLVVEDSAGEIGYLAAFSGLLAKKNSHSYFVPAIYDMQSPDGYFRTKEAKISAINDKISSLEKSSEFAMLTAQNLQTITLWDKKVASAQEDYKTSKEQRNSLRAQSDITPEALKQLITESSQQKKLIRSLKELSKIEKQKSLERLTLFTDKIENLKTLRKTKSAELQQWLFRQFRVLNNLGDSTDMVEIFSQTVTLTPPAGAGECAAPKLMQYAYTHGLKPIAMAEYWRGKSPEGEIRKDHQHYPACKAKCEPILGFMLKGLKVEKNPMEGVGDEITTLSVLYKDSDIIVIDKPSGLLSAPGKSSVQSAVSLIHSMYPDAGEPLVVHRLDMATSGVLIYAFNIESQRELQRQFTEREVTKHYLALLDGKVSSDEGRISLPLALDFINRPCQMVDHINGKRAVTRYRVIEHREDNTTLVRFYPETGRTHQLRVHSAHSEGLNAPIVGDNLYGTPSTRLLLHAEFLRLKHPKTQRTMRFHATAPSELDTQTSTKN